jgi:hypothetical protein
MANQNYSTRVEVSKSGREVFNHVNDVSKWWVREVVGTSTEFEGKSSNLNDEFILRHGDVHYSKHRLVEVIPGKKIVWLATESKLNWIKENKEEWTGTKMIFEMVPVGEKTNLIFTHDGLIPQLECYGHCVHFWDRVINDWLYNFMVQAVSKSTV